VDLRSGSRFAYPDTPGEHPAHDTQTKRYRHLNFCQFGRFLEVPAPKGKSPTAVCG
jgi:transposase